jgi:predicted ester cyclase
LDSHDALVDGWERAWSGRDGTAFAPLCTPDVQYEDPLTEGPLHGPAEVAAHALKLWRAFPDVRIERSASRLCDGEFLVAPVRVTGTNLGELDGLPATGRPLLAQALFYCQLDADARLLWRVRGFFDAYGAGVALGLLPRRGGIGERALLMLQGFGLRLRS